MQRASILQKGIDLTTGDRNATYGDPHEDLSHTARLVNAHFGTHFNSGDIAVIMVMVKLSRVNASKAHEDNYVDGATYMAIAGECYSQSALGQNVNFNEAFTGIQPVAPVNSGQSPLMGVISDDPFEGALDNLFVPDKETSYAE